MSEPDKTLAAPGDRAIGGAGARRVLFLSGAGAILGLLIAGVGLFTAQGTRTGGVPAEDAAIVNGAPILMVDFASQLRTLYDKGPSEATRVEKTRALDDMIREELYVQRGIELGMANDDVDVRSALAHSTTSQIAADLIAIKPAERELRAWFDAHRAAYAIDGAVDVADYLVPPAGAARAAALAEALRRGESPQALGLRDVGTFADGPQFLAIARRRLGDALYLQALRLAPDGVSAPVVRADGTHIAVLRSREAPTPGTFEESRPKVLEDWIGDAVSRRNRDEDRQLRSRATIKIAKALE